MEHNLDLKQFSAAIRSGKSALALVGTNPNLRVRTEIALEVATLMLATPSWSVAALIVPSETDLKHCNSPHRDLYTYYKAAVALRHNHWGEALSLAIDKNGDQDGEPSSIAAMKCTVAARAAYEQGNGKLARLLTDQAIGIAEKLSCASILRTAYDTASVVTGDRAISRKKVELDRLFAR
jgi:hypothetical protein